MGITNKVFIGIDPGVNGGIAILSPSGSDWEVSTGKMSEDAHELWDEIKSIKDRCVEYGMEPRAIIEQQNARPTSIMDRETKRWRQTVLASTVTLCGQYKLVTGMLVAAGIPTDHVIPKTWQSLFGLYKEKGEDSTKWKNRLKSLAQELYGTKTKVTLATADALLLATYGKQMCVSEDGEIELFR